MRNSPHDLCITLTVRSWSIPGGVVPRTGEGLGEEMGLSIEIIVKAAAFLDRKRRRLTRLAAPFEEHHLVADVIDGRVAGGDLIRCKDVMNDEVTAQVEEVILFVRHHKRIVTHA